MNTKQKPRTMQVTVVDPCNNNSTRVVRIKNIVPVKAGLLAVTVAENFNVFRPWGSTQWMENMTSSSRFNFETEGMSNEEMEIFLNEREVRKAAIKNSTFVAAVA